MRKNNPIDEARRYVDNARETLEEKGELDTEKFEYQDGNPSKGLCDSGFAYANRIIDRCASMVN